MIKLSTDHIRIRGKAVDEAEAIRLAASLMIKQGNIKLGCAGRMPVREKVAKCQAVLRRSFSTSTQSF